MGGHSPFPPPPPWAFSIASAGVTGTNGKTSTTRWLAAALQAGVGPVARVTTVGAYVDEEPAGIPLDYFAFLEVLAKTHARGGRFAALECTSEALRLGFAQAWPMRVGVFTNLSHDHLDAHQTFENYLASKAQLFVALPPGGTAVLNAFDPASALLGEILPPGVPLRTYGVASRGAAGEAPSVLGDIDLRATDVTVSLAGTTVTLAETPFVRASGLPRELRLRAIGEIYAENALAALAGAIALGIDGATAAAAIAAAEPPPGRFEVVHSARASARGAPVTVVVDYAHTPDALARTIATAHALTAARPPGTAVGGEETARRNADAHGPVTVVFGAGGNRDAAKRPALGAAARGADRIVLTNDNPRDEDPQAIVDAIAAGIGTGSDARATTVCLDRSEAIFQAILLCSGDGGGIVILAGKGHETTQTIGGAVVAQSDRELALDALQKLQLLGTA